MSFVFSLICNCRKSSESTTSIAFPVRRVSSLTDLHKYKEGRELSVKICKSEGNIPSAEFVILFDVSQAHEASVEDSIGQQLHTCDNEEELQSTFDETVCDSYLWTIIALL